MSSCYRDLPRCLGVRVVPNPSCISPTRHFINLRLLTSYNIHNDRSLLQNGIRTRPYLQTRPTALRTQTLSSVNELNTAHYGQYKTGNDTRRKIAYKTLRSRKFGSLNDRSRYSLLSRCRSASEADITSISPPRFPRLNHDYRSQNTLCSLLQVCRNPRCTRTCFRRLHRQNLSTVTVSATEDAQVQPQTRIGPTIRAEIAFREQNSGLGPNESPSLRLPIIFYHHFKQLTWLQRWYGKLQYTPGKHLTYFRRFLSSPKLKYLTGHELVDWVHTRRSPFQPSYLHRVLLGSMVSSAQKTLDILAHIGPLQDDYSTRMHCLIYIFWAHNEELNTDKDLMDQFDAQVTQLITSTDWPKKGMTRAEIRLILRRSETQVAKDFISRYLAFYVAPSFKALSEFAYYYVGSGNIELAFEMVSKMPDEALQKPDRVLEKIITRILRHDTVVQSVSGPAFQYLSKLLEKGFRPWPYLHAIFIEHALNGGYVSVAWDLYRYLSSIENEISARIYLLLLRHSFLQKDVQGVNEMMSVIHSKEELYTDRFILGYAMNTIRNICYYGRQCSADEALSHTLALYDRAYNRDELLKLGIVTQDVSREARSKLWDPPPTMLSFVIWSYILCDHHPSFVHRLWSWIRYLADQGDDKILRALEYDIIYSGFILFYGRSQTTLVNALQVLEYMLEKKYCRPNSRTWSLLICGYLKHHQVAQARKIAELMTQYGFTLTDLPESLMPAGYTIENLIEYTDDIMDERSMPLGLETQEGHTDFAQMPHAPISGDAVWDELVDLRSLPSNELV